MKKEIVIDSRKEKELRGELAGRDDAEARRLTRFLETPDLSRKEGSPIAELARRIVAIPDFKEFDIIKAPEIVPARESFDLFNFPPDHPARSRSDTYYVNNDYILRTHTTIMWYYQLALQDVKQKIKEGKPFGALCHGKVYRKDEIDRHHMNVFHQIDGWYVCRKKEKQIGLEELKDVLLKIARAIYGDTISYRFNVDQFPYTDPSLEMEIDLRSIDAASARSFGEPQAAFAKSFSEPQAAFAKSSGEPRWVEVLGSGVVRGEVLENFGVDSRIYNGWAFGFGLERLAILSMSLPDIRLLWSEDERVKRQLVLGRKYEEVSKYPPIVRDISFVVGKDFVPNNYFDLIRDIGDDLVEEVLLLDKYEDDEKFGKGKISYTYRIVYRSNERTLINEEVTSLQETLETETKKQFSAHVR